VVESGPATARTITVVGEPPACVVLAQARR
jgi:hypothetical protein